MFTGQFEPLFDHATLRAECDAAARITSNPSFRLALFYFNRK
jgi:hypothetical protein